MPALVEIIPWLLAMVVLIVCSAFFSASEAALFFLRRSDRLELQSGTRSERIAAKLLDDPDRLLSAILFWNLFINIVYFSIASIASIQLGKNPDTNSSTPIAFTFGALLALIFFSEMLPKSIAVLRTRSLASFVGIPLTVAVRILDPLMPSVQLVTLLSKRILWPHFQPEPYLEVADLERAIELSTNDAALVEQEQTSLHNIVLLSDIRVDELMRPRMQFLSFRPPVSLSDLEGRLPPSGYLLVTEPDSEEVAGAIHLQNLSYLPEKHLELHAEPVLYVPWCTSVADAMHQMQSNDRDIAAVINEFGETIGILTFEDILDTIFSYSPSRSDRLLNRQAIQQQQPGLWHVTSMTSLRRLSRYFEISLPSSKSVTVAGILQERLQRLPAPGDQCSWGPFHFKVIDAQERGQMVIELTCIVVEEPER